MSAVEQWKKRSSREVELPSGVKVTLALTTLRDEILAGSFSGPVLALARQMESATLEQGRELSDDDLESYRALRHTLIARSVRAVEGEAVTLTADDVAQLPVDDVDDLWLYVMRLRPLPKAAA